MCVCVCVCVCTIKGRRRKAGYGFEGNSGVGSKKGKCNSPIRMRIIMLFFGVLLKYI